MSKLTGNRKKSKEKSLDDTVGRWHGVYDPTSDGEIEWLLYVAKYLPDEDIKTPS